MVEEDAKVIADLNGWGLVNQDFTCRDRAHTPKGRVYLNSDTGAYYGADNTGHVGWGFKVWEKWNKTTWTTRATSSGTAAPGRTSHAGPDPPPLRRNAYGTTNRAEPTLLTPVGNSPTRHERQFAAG